LKIIVCCIGKTKSPELRATISDYLKRLSHYTEVELAELSDAQGVRDIKSVLSLEEQIFVKKIQKAPYFILDEKGQVHDSLSFSAFIQKQRNTGRKYFLSSEVRMVSVMLLNQQQPAVSPFLHSPFLMIW
jgi:23S rRNA (pseudouridine1915-N3)-methyltransferase